MERLPLEKFLKGHLKKINKVKNKNRIKIDIHKI